MRARGLACALACAVLAAAFAFPHLASAAGAVVTAEEFASSLDAAIARLDQPGAAVDASGAAALASAIESGPLAPTAVEFDGRAMEPDRARLAALAAQLRDARTQGARDDALEGLRANLVSMRQALGERGGAPVRSDAAALRRLLAGRAPGKATAATNQDWFGTWLMSLISRIASWLGTPGSSGGGGRWLLWAVLAAAAVVAIAVLARGAIAVRRGTARRSRAEAADGGPVVAAAEGVPADALAFADRMAAEGRGREAVRALFGGAARGLEAAGVVRRTRTRTDAELLRDVRASAPAVAGPLEQLTHGFESAWYGHLDPGPDGFTAARAAYADVLDEVRRAHARAGEGARDGERG